MASIEEQIKELEEQLSKTKYNKATEGHIGKIKAKIAKLTQEDEKRKSAKGNTKGFYVKKASSSCMPPSGVRTLLAKETMTSWKESLYWRATSAVASSCTPLM